MSLVTSLSRAVMGRDYLWQMDAPLLLLPVGNRFALRDAFEGVHIMGGIGSGKTSGSGAMLARQYLLAGMGGMILCAKRDEAPMWLRLAKECGRANSVIHLRPEGNHRFNFLDYELKRPDGGGYVENIVGIFDALRQALEAHRGGQVQRKEDHWTDSAQEMLRHLLVVLIVATGRISMEEILRFMQSIPRSEAQITSDAPEYVRFRESSFALKMIAQAMEQQSPPVRYAHDLEVAARYFRYETTGANEKGTHSIISTLNTLLGGFKTGLLHQLFCSDSTFCPDMAGEGSLILLDIPVESHKTLGIQAQTLMKYMFQDYARARHCSAKTRPVFLWVDEAHLFYTEYDNLFQSISRSSRVCSVYLTQNMASYRMDERTVRNFLGNFGTKIFHTNSCTLTNQYVSEMIGRVKHIDQSGGMNTGVSEGESRGKSKGGGWTSSPHDPPLSGGSFNRNRGTSRSSNNSRSSGVSQNWSERMDWEVEPNVFIANLRTGGKRHRCIVDGVMVKHGGFHGGQRWLPVSFFQ